MYFYIFLLVSFHFISFIKSYVLVYLHCTYTEQLRQSGKSGFDQRGFFCFSDIPAALACKTVRVSEREAEERGSNPLVTDRDRFRSMYR